MNPRLYLEHNSPKSTTAKHHSGNTQLVLLEQVLQALSSAERVARTRPKLYLLSRGRGNWRIAQLLQDALPNIALDYANKQVGGGAPLFIYLPATSVAVPPTLYPPVCTLSICPSVCLSVGLFGLVFAWLSVKTDGLKAQGCCRCRSWRCTCASSSRTPLAAADAAPAVCASQTEASRGGRVGGWRHTQKEKHEAAKNNSILSEK